MVCCRVFSLYDFFLIAARIAHAMCVLPCVSSWLSCSVAYARACSELRKIKFYDVWLALVCYHQAIPLIARATAVWCLYECTACVQAVRVVEFRSCSQVPYLAHCVWLADGVLPCISSVWSFPDCCPYCRCHVCIAVCVVVVLVQCAYARACSELRKIKFDDVWLALVCYHQSIPLIARATSVWWLYECTACV